MTLAITFLDESTDTNSGSSTVVSGTISPTANALLIAVIHFNDNGPNDVVAPTDTLTGTSAWTQQAYAKNDNYNGNDDAGCAIYTAIAGSSPGSGTITGNVSNNCARKILHVIEVTGFDTTTPVAQTATNTGTSSTSLTVTLSSTPATTSMVFGAVSSYELTADNLISPGTGFTELAETNVGGATVGSNMQTQYDYASADTTCDWSGLGTTIDAGCAIEINEAAGAADVSDPPKRVRPLRILRL